MGLQRVVRSVLGRLDELERQGALEVGAVVALKQQLVRVVDSPNHDEGRAAMAELLKTLDAVLAMKARS